MTKREKSLIVIVVVWLIFVLIGFVLYNKKSVSDIENQIQELEEINDGENITAEESTNNIDEISETVIEEPIESVIGWDYEDFLIHDANEYQERGVYFTEKEESVAEQDHDNAMQDEYKVCEADENIEANTDESLLLQVSSMTNDNRTVEEIVEEIIATENEDKTYVIFDSNNAIERIYPGTYTVKNIVFYPLLKTMDVNTTLNKVGVALIFDDGAMKYLHFSMAINNSETLYVGKTFEIEEPAMFMLEGNYVIVLETNSDN